MLADLAGPAAYDRAHSVVHDADENILVAGHSWGVEGETGFAFLVRLTPNGALDPSFGEDGMVATDIGTTTPYGHSLTVDGNTCSCGLRRGAD